MIREPCAGVLLTVSTPVAAVDSTLRSAKGKQGRAIHFCNAHTLSIAHADDAYRELLTRAGACYPDGQSVVWVRKVLNRNSRMHKVSGPDFFEAVLGASSAGGPLHYLLGGDEPTLEGLRRQLAARFPEAQVVGWESPPFRKLTDDEVRAQDDRIRDSRAEIVWVGLGTPKQDYEVRRLADALPVTAVAVGAAFDFTAGTKPRAPRWMRSAGLEWLHRLASEPRRLWRRYLIGNVVFVWAAWRRRDFTS